MRVLHVRPQLQRGGATEYVIRLAQGLSDRRHQVFIATGGGNWVERTRRYATVDTTFALAPRVGKLPNLPALMASAARLTRLVRREQIDVINSHHRFAALAGRMASLLSGVPLVTTLHEVPRGSPQLTVFGLGQRVVTLSTMMRDLVVSRYKLAPGRVHLIPMGVATLPSLSDQRRVALRAQLGLPEAASIIGCVARLTARKGQIFLLQALPVVLAAHPQTHILLVGDGPDRAALAHMARELGVAHAVTFAGARDDAQELINLCDFTVLPSLEEEFGIVLIESLAQQRPVVATAVGGVPEIIKPHENGLLVPARDSVALSGALITLLGQPDLTRSLGQNGFREVERRFSLPAFIESTEALYASLTRPERVGTIV